jgi:hypothetical protein
LLKRRPKSPFGFSASPNAFFILLLCLLGASPARQLSKDKIRQILQYPGLTPRQLAGNEIDYAERTDS